MAGASFYTLVLLFRFFLIFLALAARLALVAFGTLIFAVVTLTARLVAALVSKRACLV